MSEGRGAGTPGAPAQVPGLPENFRDIKIEGFAGINTKLPRPAIRDQELAWCDGWMPVGPNMLRILPGTADPLFTIGGGKTIEWFAFCNIGDSEFCIALDNTGSLIAITVPGGVATTIATGIISSPSTILGFAQWGSQYVLFAKDQTNGYWIWDGTNFYSAGTASPVTTISDGGAGYTSIPTVNTFGGSGSGIVLAAQIENGAVSLVNVTNPGSGYQLTDHVVMLFSGGNGTRTAIGTATLTNGVITSTFLQSGGSGYQSGTGVQSPPTVTVSDGVGPGTGAVIVVDGVQGGIVTSLKIVSGGSGYVSPVLSFGGPGTGAQALAFADQGVVTGLTLVDGGLGYATTPTVTLIGSSGAGAVLEATIGAGGAVTQVQVQAGGKGYTSPTYVTFAGGNGPAVGTIEMMPFGVSGTCIENYQGHVWIGNGAASAVFPPKGRVIFSAGGDPADFGDDGGAFLDTNSFARVGYHSLRQTNGFLYLIADSSLDYISGVTTTAATTTPPAPAATTFNNQNADPQIGSPWPSSATVYSRNIVFANPVGIYVSLGGAVTKVSGPLDGFYFTGATLTTMTDAPSAVAEIFGNVVYMLLLSVVDPITDTTVSKLLMWDAGESGAPSRWFTSQQDRALTYIATREKNSTLQAWGTDGTRIFQLFAQPSTGFTKTFQSKLYSNPAYWMTKTANELFGVVENPSAPMTITVDNELGNGTGGGSVSLLASSNQFNVFGPIPVGQSGSLIGLTVSTTAADATVMSLTIVETDEATRL